MPYDAMVEVPCYLRKWGPEPVTIGNIPQFQLGMMMQQVSSEKLIVDAYFEHSYQKALEAFTMNKTVPSAKVARKILDKMIEPIRLLARTALRSSGGKSWRRERRKLPFHSSRNWEKF